MKFDGPARATTDDRPEYMRLLSGPVTNKAVPKLRANKDSLIKDPKVAFDTWWIGVKGKF